MESTEEEIDSPVIEGEKISLTVESFGTKGDAVARIKNLVIFIQDSESLEKGKTYECEITRVLKKYAFAKLA